MGSNFLNRTKLEGVTYSDSPPAPGDVAQLLRNVRQVIWRKDVRNDRETPPQDRIPPHGEYPAQCAANQAASSVPILYQRPVGGGAEGGLLCAVQSGDVAK